MTGYAKTQEILFVKAPRTLDGGTAINARYDRTRDHHIRFALFVKILFKYLDDIGEVSLSTKGRYLVRMSTKMNRKGHPAFQPLLERLEKRLRDLVGEVHWRRAHGYMRYYLSKRRAERIDPTNSMEMIRASGISFGTVLQI